MPPVPTVPPVPTGVIDRRRAEAESVLAAATAGEPRCELADGGDPTEPKYAEGADADAAQSER